MKYPPYNIISIFYKTSNHDYECIKYLDILLLLAVIGAIIITIGVSLVENIFSLFYDYLNSYERKNGL